MKIGIVGLGLIGASFAKAITQYTRHEVLGYDTDKDVLEAALKDKCITRELTDGSLLGIDILILALRPKDIKGYIIAKNAFLSSKCIVIDVAGIKREVQDFIEFYAKKQGFLYIGGHPMAGKERGGYVNSSPLLFRDAYMILSPRVDVSKTTIERLKGFFKTIGFRDINITTPEEHDKMISYTSQLPHVLSNAFVKSKAFRTHKGFSADSLKDLTRTASLDVEMWTELFFENKDNLIETLDEFIGNIKEYQTALEKNDVKMMKKLLQEGVDIKTEVI